MADFMISKDTVLPTDGTVVTDELRVYNWRNGTATIGIASHYKTGDSYLTIVVSKEDAQNLIKILKKI